MNAHSARLRLGRRIRQTLSKLHTDARAVTALEYAMIAVAAVTVITGLGTALNGVFASVNSAP
jgi:Flp pilus assembly pilin Flp